MARPGGPARSATDTPFLQAAAAGRVGLHLAGFHNAYCLITVTNLKFLVVNFFRKGRLEAGYRVMPVNIMQ